MSKRHTYAYGFQMDPNRRFVHILLKPCHGTITNNDTFTTDDNTQKLPARFVKTTNSMEEAVSEYNKAVERELAVMADTMNTLKNLLI